MESAENCEAPARTEVTVRPTGLIAAEQIKSEEKQRLIGVIPKLLHKLHL
jgi:hypothetical protein